MFFQQFCGVSVLAYVGEVLGKPTTYTESRPVFKPGLRGRRIERSRAIAGFDGKYSALKHALEDPFLTSWSLQGFGLINFLFAIPAFYTIDTFGRRNLLLFTFPFMALFQLLTGLGFLLEGRGQLAMVMTGMCESRYLPT